jgi:hypothetical protein
MGVRSASPATSSVVGTPVRGLASVRPRLVKIERVVGGMGVVCTLVGWSGQELVLGVYRAARLEDIEREQIHHDRGYCLSREIVGGGRISVQASLPPCSANKREGAPADQCLTQTGESSMPHASTVKTIDW